jgi:hypothetical protein
MKSKKGSVILISILAIIAAGVLIALLTNWPVDRGQADGDIAKSSRFSRKTAAESLSMMEELVLNDEDYKNSIVLSYVVMLTRAEQFGSLVDLSAEAAGDIPAFADVLEKMNGAREMIDNVCASLQEAGESLEATLSGGSSPELGQRTNNAAVAYRTLQKQNMLASQFIDTADKYLEANEGSEQLKFVRDQWVVYQQATAALEGDEKLAKKLAAKEILSAEMLGLMHRETVDPSSLETENLIGENTFGPTLSMTMSKPFASAYLESIPTVSEAVSILEGRLQSEETIGIDEQLLAGKLNNIIIHLSEAEVDLTLDARITVL